MKKKTDDSISMFYGYWKIVGLVSTFLVGLVLAWWGMNVYITNWFLFVHNAGKMAYILLTPLIVGVALGMLSFAEMLRIIRK